MLIQSTSLKAGSPQFKAVVADVMERLDGTKGVDEVTSPYAGGGAKVSPDGHSALVGYELPGDETKAKTAIDAPVAATADVAEAHPDFTVGAFGEASSEKELMKRHQRRSPQGRVHLAAGHSGRPAAGVRGDPDRRCAGAPGALGGPRDRRDSSPISQISPVSDSISSVVLLIGLAVGVDYALFYVRRVREEREAGRGHEAAIDAAAATSGRAVLVSGFTVVTAMAGMYLAGAADFASYATGTIVVVALAMAGSLTVLPALLEDRRPGRPPPRPTARRPQGARCGGWTSGDGSPGGCCGARRGRRGVHRLPAGPGVPGAGHEDGQPRPGVVPAGPRAVVQTFNRVQDAFPSETRRRRSWSRPRM